MSTSPQVAPQFRVVAIPAAIAVGAIGAIAAERVHLPWALGALGGALAAGLTVLALPSLPTRRATVVLLGVGGLGALRHASFAGSGHSWLLVVWAIATMVTLLLVDRADAEVTPAMHGAAPLPSRAKETARASALIMAIVVAAAVAVVPSLTERLGRHVWPGADPTFGAVSRAPTSLQSTDQLDVTTRPRLSDSIVFTVDAKRPDFWRGETFDVYDGSTWSRTTFAPFEHEFFLDRDGTNVAIPPASFDPGSVNGEEFRQTFHIETDFSNVVFAAPSPRIVQTDKPLYARRDGTVRVAGGTTAGFGKGAVYTVVSRSMHTTEAMLRRADNEPVPDEVRAQYAQQPVTTERVRALGRRITAQASTTYDKVRAIEAWLGTNTKYSLNAPTAPHGVDVVDDFLFNSRLGWCEQIASSLVILARSAGIPARLATGFVSDKTDPLTGRFVVREKNAHAWAEVYFPGVGWQGFDPTASVPLAGEAPASGSWIDSARRNIVSLVFLVLFVIALAVAVPRLVAAGRSRHSRRTSWSTRALHDLERIGRKAGRARAPAETPREYARVLAGHVGDDRLCDVGDVLDVDGFSEHGASREARDAADAVLTSIRP